MKKRTCTILLVIWLMIMVGIGASTVTLLLSGRTERSAQWVSDEDYAVLERYSRLEQIRRTLTDGYYQEVDEDVLLTGAIRGMMAALNDRYTFYYTPEEMARLAEEAEGVYHGLGILLQNNRAGFIEVLRVYAGSPAETGGLRVGDEILSVNGENVYGTDAKSLAEASGRMQGEDGTALLLGVRRGDETLSLTLVRGNVSISNVRFRILDGNIGYICIFQFTGDDREAFTAALGELKQAGVCALVVDVRNNPGGLLTDVVDIADQLLPEGLVVYTEDRAGSRTDFYSSDSYWDVPLVVLVNEMSASASEILAAAVQDTGRGTVLGTTSYGKGIVQTVISFDSDGAGMQYTSACYYTPSGRSIHGTGVTPDVYCEDGGSVAAYSGIAEPESDPQLAAALELLKKQTEEKN